MIKEEEKGERGREGEKGDGSFKRESRVCFARGCDVLEEVEGWTKGKMGKGGEGWLRDEGEGGGFGMLFVFGGEVSICLLHLLFRK